MKIDKHLQSIFLVVLIPLFLPGLLWAELSPPAGTVTQVAGQASLNRTGIPKLLPVRFRDDVYLQDEIRTKEQSLVRVLLGGKALVTIRELSVLTITEEVGHATIDIKSGTVALAVARKRMRPGEFIEIRTPHASAAVRGTLMVAETGKEHTQFSNVPELGNGQEDDSCKSPVDVVEQNNSVQLCAGQSVRGDASGLGTVENMDPTTEAVMRNKTKAEPEMSEQEGAITENENQSIILANALAGTDGEGSSIQAETNPEFGETGNPANDLLVSTQLAGIDPALGASSGSPSGPIINGSLEQQGLAGWTNVSQVGSGPGWTTYTANSPLVTGSGFPPPPDGPVGAASQEGNLPGSRVLFQEFTIPSTNQNPILAFDLFVDGNTFDTQNGARVDVLLPGTNPFSVLPQDLLLPLFQTANGSQGPISPNFQTLSFDLAPFTSQLIRLRFTEVSGGPQCCVHFLLDNVLLMGRVDTPVSLLRLFGPHLVTVGSTAPHIRLDGEDHLIATSVGSAMFDLAGRPSAIETDSDTGLPVGTDQPIQGKVNGTAGPVPQPLLETAGEATVTGQQFLKIDTALLEASAPLFHLTQNSTLTTESGVIELSYQAKVINQGPIAALDASILNVNSGPLLALAGGSIVNVVGDLLTLTNGSSVNINGLADGFLINASGGSNLNVTGALVNFGGTGGNIITVNNTVVPTFTTPVGGIPISLTNGAQASQVTVAGTPIVNPDLGSIALPNQGSLIQIDGPGTQVTIQGGT